MSRHKASRFIPSARANFTGNEERFVQELHRLSGQTLTESTSLGYQHYFRSYMEERERVRSLEHQSKVTKSILLHATKKIRKKLLVFQSLAIFGWKRWKRISKTLNHGMFAFI